MPSSFKKIGLIVNPVAGLGGRVGLKGSDGAEIQAKAVELGAVPRSGERARAALSRLKERFPELKILTSPGPMGEESCHGAGLKPEVLDLALPASTSAQETKQAARLMVEAGIDLLLFAGGDGTARDIHDAVGDSCPALGIPAGVKIHSAVYARNPVSTGDLGADFLAGRGTLNQAEVLDLDENVVRSGRIQARLYGYLRVPFRAGLNQAVKAPSRPGSDPTGPAREVIRNMGEGLIYLLGPGTTLKAISVELGIEYTLIGIDAVKNRRLIDRDLNEKEMTGLISGAPSKIVVTPIGGQGFIFGRGNQQFSPEVIRRVGPEGVVILATREKLDSLGGRPLLVDTGDPDLDAQLSGFVRVITGVGERTVYRVSA